MNKKICIIGSSGFAKEVYWLIQEAGMADNVECFMEPEKYWAEKNVFNIPVKKQSEFDASKHIAVLGIGDPMIRKKIVTQQLPYNTEYPSIIHPSTKISKWVNMGRGAIICAYNMMTCDIKIGDFAVINLNCTIGHDCVIGDYFTLNPSVNVSGLCEFGNQVYIGTNAAVKQGIKICNDVTIGMGACVVKDIIEPGIYVGNPAKPLTTK